MILSLIAPVKASRSPTVWSSNLGQSTPGVSSISKPFATVNHWLPRVTPGRSADTALLRPATRLMKVDFPTFGMPTIMTRIDGLSIPLALYDSMRGARSSLSAGTNLSTPRPLLQSTAMARVFSPERALTHSAVALRSAMSHLFSRMTRGLPAVRVAISGLRDDTGILASMISATASTSLRSFSIWRLVFVMWPGNHWIVWVCTDGAAFLSTLSFLRRGFTGFWTGFGIFCGLADLLSEFFGAVLPEPDLGLELRFMRSLLPPDLFSFLFDAFF